MHCKMKENGTTDEMGTKPIFQESFIQTNGIKLHYLDWGGSGQPLILIHGLGDSPYIFEDIASFLKNDFRIIAYSRRGHGTFSHAQDGRRNISADNCEIEREMF